MKLNEILICLIVCFFICGCLRVDTSKEVKLNIDNGEYSQNNSNTPASNDDDSKTSWLTKLSKVGHTVSNSIKSDFYTDDVLAAKNKKVKLVAHCDLEEQPKDGLHVVFYLNGKKLGQAVTDENGIAYIEWLPPKAEQIQIIDAELYFGENLNEENKIRQSKLTVSVQDGNTPIVIVDLDKTLVQSSFFRVVLDAAKPLPYSANAMNMIAKRYSIVYLTHRFSGMTSISKQWLSDNGFPVGPLLTNKSGALSSGNYKYGKLANLKEKFKNIEIGVGDKETDIESCRSNGIKAYWIVKYKEKSRSLQKLAKKAAKFNNDENVQVVINWQEIEEGILRGKDFSAARRSEEFRKLAIHQKNIKEKID